MVRRWALVVAVALVAGCGVDADPAAGSWQGRPDEPDRKVTIGVEAGWPDGISAVVRRFQPTVLGEYTTRPGSAVIVRVSIRNGGRRPVELAVVAELRLGLDRWTADGFGCDAVGGRLLPGRTTDRALCFAGGDVGMAAELSLRPVAGAEPVSWTGTVR